MFGLGTLTFLAPWALAAAVVLPVLWWLLRVTPPSPRLIRFPAVRLLFGLAAREETPARTPWWLILLRLLLATLLILAVAHPIINADTRVAGSGPVLIVIDDGWAAARHWQRRQAALARLLDQAERAQRPVILLPTAPPADGGPVRPSGLMAAAEARAIAQAMTPKPWPSDRIAAEAAVRRMESTGTLRLVWLSDGIDSPGATDLARRLQTLGVTESFVDDPGGLARALLPPRLGDRDFTPRLRRVAPGPEERVWVRASDAGGRTIARQQTGFAAGAVEAGVTFELPSELRNRVARLDVEDEASAAAVVLVDERWRRRPVGLVASGAAELTPLLLDRNYAEKALAPYVELRQGGIDELLSRSLSVTILPDGSRPTPLELARLDDWVNKGGVLLRLAGPSLSRTPDALLPVRLRGGGRTLGGALSWTAPMTLAPFPDHGPFAGLPVPPDVRVSTQVLAEPEIDLNAKTWARLTDGTPLVTAEHRGRGWLVLIHTTGAPTWSNLPISGLFVDMLRRLVSLSQGVTETQADVRLPPVEVLDGFGRLRPPVTAVGAIEGRDFAKAKPSPRTPPGFYGDDSARRALNLGPAVAEMKPLVVPSGVVVSSYSQAQREIDLKPWLLAAALALAVVDMAIALALRGLLWRGAAAAALAGLALLPARPAQAQNEALAFDAALNTRLAYVRTGDADADHISEAGLMGLTRVLERRSTVVMAPPMAVDLENDPLLFFPLVYWPVTDGQPPPSAEAADKINAYLRHGGMILFDTRDQGALPGGDAPAAGGRLQALTASLAIPPLVPVAPDHVLTKAFYLLRDMPGRYTGGAVWIERTNEQVNDGVSSVVIGANDWASAWAIDQRGRPLLAVVPGGEQQREMAYRFGVNLVMYALTGNYKGDQVHVPHILERLSR